MVELIPRSLRSWVGGQEAKANGHCKHLGAAWVLLVLLVYFFRGTKSLSIKSCKINCGFMQLWGFLVPEAMVVGGRVFADFCDGLQGGRCAQHPGLLGAMPCALLGTHAPQAGGKSSICSKTSPAPLHVLTSAGMTWRAPTSTCPSTWNRGRGNFYDFCLFFLLYLLHPAAAARGVQHCARASLQIPWEAQGNVNRPRGK